MLHNLSVGELAERLRKKELTSLELTRHFLGRIERLGPALNAFLHRWCAHQLRLAHSR
jgi:aspartyl-tRNA(Asn)/glutamyl-tRNA(Gln) amidotransferase subunit A